MQENEPMLRIDISKRGNPRCSVCKAQFGDGGFARDLISAFAFHVSRHHMPEDTSRASRFPKDEISVRGGSHSRRRTGRQSNSLSRKPGGSNT
jgi:hypothetical protein